MEIRQVIKHYYTESWHMLPGVLLLLMWGLTAPSSDAQIPLLIRYQGTLVDANNVPLEGAHTLTFRLYPAATGGSAVWTEAQTGVPISRGVFNVLLGQVVPLTVPFEKDYWLSVQVDADSEMSPRQRLTSVPYAYRAQVADQVQDQPPGFEVDTGGTLTDGLMAYWKFEESGGTRDDQKGPNDLLDHNTVTQAAGKKGNAAKFTRADAEYLSAADNADLSGGDVGLTIALWVYADTLTPNFTIFSKFDFGGGAEQGYIREYVLYYESALRWGGRGGSTGFEVSGGAMSASAWHFVVCWHDPDANTVNIQVDNGAVSSASHAAGLSDTGINFLLGATHVNGAIGELMNGRIDEAGFWKRVLTAQERADLYNNGAGTTYSLGKAASPWTQADTGIAYTAGRIGIGTLAIPNILSVQQGSPTDPIADSWTVYPSDRQHKHIIRSTRSGYLAQLRTTELYEWTRTPMASDGEAKQELRKSRPTTEELRAKKRDLTLAKARLPKFTTKRVGPAIDDANVPAEILTFNPDGTKAGIDLLAYLGYLHAALKEAALELDQLKQDTAVLKQR